MGAKFKAGEIVLYKNKNELAEIKEVIEHSVTQRKRLKQDGLHAEASGEEYTELVYSYRVWTHTGDTSALCSEGLLEKIPNLYAFNIVRRLADVDKAIDVATNKLEELNALIQQHTNQELISHNSNESAMIHEDTTVEYVDSIHYVLVLFLKELIYGERKQFFR